MNLAGSSQVAPTFWLNPKNGVSYPIVVQTPQYANDSISALHNVSVTGVGTFQTLNNVSNIHRGLTSALITHYSIRPAIDIYATTQGRDLGAVAADIDQILKATAEGPAQGLDRGAARPGADHERAPSPACSWAWRVRSC